MNPTARTYALLRDGSQAALRPFEAADHDTVEAFLEAVSLESRTLRFHAAVSVSAALVNRMTSGHAIVAEAGGELVAIGSYYPLRDPRRAEVALVVADAQQGRGIGTALLERLAADARAEGIERFVALVMPENAPMLEVFENLGLAHSRHLDAGEWEYEISLAPSASTAQRDHRRHVAAEASLRPLFRPRAIAVVGASRRPGSPGHAIFRNLLNGGFGGAVYPVNHSAGAVRGVHAYPRVSDIPEPVDLVVIAVPTASVLDVARDSIEAGARGLVVISAGFAEAGDEGRQHQAALLELVRSHGARMVGPNCLGVLANGEGGTVNATFAAVLPPAGGVAIASQSGALGIAILDQARKTGMGVSAFVSMGNKADVSSNDLLEYWEDDPDTKVIVLYLESFGNPKRFARVARRVGRSKPIVAVKGGRGEAGMRAAQSHTAALAGSTVAVDALFRQAGVTHCETLEESFDVSLLFEKQPLPAGGRVGIVSNAGGLGILCADACEANGLSLPALGEDSLTRLGALLPDAMHAANPLDIGASSPATTYSEALQLMLADPAVDAVIALFVPLATNRLEDAADALAEAVAAGSGKPVLACFAGFEWPATASASAREVPLFRFPETAARALGHAAARAVWLRRPEGSLPSFDDVDTKAGRAIVDAALARESSPWLTAAETRALLDAYRVPMPRSIIARSAEEAANACSRIGGPVAVKLVSSTVLHKTDVGGVRLDISGPDAAAEAYREMQAGLETRELGEAFEGVLVQEMIEGGVECIVGVVTDPLFGPLIAFGLGGTVAEALGDVAFRLHPLADHDADELIASVKAARLLAGYRGAEPADVPALRELLLRVSQLVEDIPELAEFDLNPVVALPRGRGVLALDARMRLQRLR